MAEPKAFPYNPVLLAFFIGILTGIARGMQARFKELYPDAKGRIRDLMAKKKAGQASRRF